MFSSCVFLRLQAVRLKQSTPGKHQQFQVFEEKKTRFAHLEMTGLTWKSLITIREHSFQHRAYN